MHVVKRQGHKEKYDQKKVYASVYAAVLNCHYSEKPAEKIAAQVTKKVNTWIRKKSSITSSNIRDQIIKNLSELKDRHIALMYKHHLDIC